MGKQYLMIAVVILYDGHNHSLLIPNQTAIIINPELVCIRFGWLLQIIVLIFYVITQFGMDALILHPYFTDSCSLKKKHGRNDDNDNNNVFKEVSPLTCTSGLVESKPKH